MSQALVLIAGGAIGGIVTALTLHQIADLSLTLGAIVNPKFLI